VSIQVLVYSSKTKQILGRDLNKLKINIAHYGGIEQWEKHQDSDRNDLAQEIMEMPDEGIHLFSEQANPSIIKPHKPAVLWERADWYAIISSLMLQYEGIYADISYILHTPEIRPLLNLTLQNKKLSKKVLFGTDFYVIRNHKSEKELYAELLDSFSDEEFHLMSRINPNQFLKTKRYPEPLIETEEMT
ncbi:MAG: hypothetical protein AAFR66_16740, partial [Bacteroidota bacterium]